MHYLAQLSYSASPTCFFLELFADHMTFSPYPRNWNLSSSTQPSSTEITCACTRSEEFYMKAVYVCAYFACTYVHVCLVSTEPEEGIGSPGTGGKDDFKKLCGYLELKPGSSARARRILIHWAMPSNPYTSFKCIHLLSVLKIEPRASSMLGFVIELHPIWGLFGRNRDNIAD